jgi:hypothetical protein
VNADVEAASMAPAETEGDASSAVGRTGMPGFRVAWPEMEALCETRLESWMSGSCVAWLVSYASCGAQPKSVE